MRLYQYKEGFRYTSDTIFLWDFASRFIKKGDTLEVGGGCGILGLLLARDFKINLTIVEKEPKMAKLCTMNAKENSIDANVRNIDFLDFSGEKYDYIVSNPPYYPDRVVKSQNSPLISARYAPSLPLDVFLQKAKKLLKPQGEIIFCYDASESCLVINEISKLKGATLTHLMFVHSKLQKPSKLAFFRVKNSSKAHLQILPPLIVMDENNGYTNEALQIFGAANTDSIDIDPI